MKSARSDWPVWFQILGAVAVVLAVGVLAGAGWALLAGGGAVLTVGVLTELDRLMSQRPPARRAQRPANQRAES